GGCTARVESQREEYLLLGFDVLKMPRRGLDDVVKPDDYGFQDVGVFGHASARSAYGRRAFCRGLQTTRIDGVRVGIVVELVGRQPVPELLSGDDIARGVGREFHD